MWYLVVNLMEIDTRSTGKTAAIHNVAFGPIHTKYFYNNNACCTYGKYI